MSIKNDNYIFLTISNLYYTLLRVKKGRTRWEIVEFETNLHPFDPKKQTQFDLKQKFTSTKETNGPCYLILPRHEITARIVTLPSQDINEIKNMIALSAEEYVPYSSDEICTAQIILRKLPNSESEVLVIIAHKELIQEKINIIKNLGLELAGIIVSTGSMFDSLPAFLSSSLQENNPIGVVHLTLEGIEFALFHKEKLLSTRGFQFQWDNIKNREESVKESQPAEIINPFSTSISSESDKWSSSLQSLDTDHDPIAEIYREVKNSINAYQRETETDFSISTLYISSDFPFPNQEIKRLEEKLSIPCKTVSSQFIPFENTELLVPPISLPLFGCALSVTERLPLHLNLLPEEIVRIHTLRETLHHLKHCAVLTAILCLSLISLFIQNIWQREKFIRELEQQIAEIESSARGVAEMRQQLQILRREVAKNGSALDFLSKIMEVAHANVNLNTYSYRRNEGINLWGRAKTVDDVHSFADNLRKLANTTSLKAFAQARSVYEQRVTEYNQMIFDYQITIPFVEEEESNGTSSTPNQ